MIPRVIKKTVDLSKAQSVDTLTGPLYQLENGGHTFEITILKDGTAASISGSVTARFIRADGETVFFSGTLTNNVASVTLPQNCYVVNGRFGLVVFVAGSGVTSAVYALAGTVYRSTTDTVVDPESAVPSIEDFLGIIDDCETATAAAEAAAASVTDYNSFDLISKTRTNKGPANGITWTWNADGSCTVTGQKTGAGVYLLEGSDDSPFNVLPAWVTPGKTYYFEYSGQDVILHYKAFKNGTAISGSEFNLRSNKAITVPSDADGLYIRLEVATSSVINETVKPVILNAYGNKELTEKIEQIYTDNSGSGLTNSHRGTYTADAIIYPNSDFASNDIRYVAAKNLFPEFNCITSNKSNVNVIFKNGTAIFDCTDLDFSTQFEGNVVDKTIPVDEQSAQMYAFPSGMTVGSSYTFAFVTDNPNNYISGQLFFYNSSRSMIDSYSWNTKNAFASKTVTIPSGAVYYRLWMKIVSGATGIYKVQWYFFDSSATVTNLGTLADPVSVKVNNTGFTSFPGLSIIDDAKVADTYEDAFDSNMMRLGYVSPEMFGAKADGYTDDSNAFASCLAYANERNKAVNALGRYYVTQPVSIAYSMMTVNINRLIYNGSDAAIIIMGQSNNVTVNNVISNAVGIRVYPRTIQNCEKNSIKTIRVWAVGNSIEFIPEYPLSSNLHTWCMASYSRLDFQILISMSGDGLHLEHTFGEKVIYGGTILAPAGWSIYNEDGNDSFYSISLESKHGILEKYGWNNYFGFRTAELTDVKRFHADEYPNDPNAGLLFKYEGYEGGNSLWIGRSVVYPECIDISDRPTWEELWAEYERRGETSAQNVISKNCLPNRFICGAVPTRLAMYTNSGNMILVYPERIILRTDVQTSETQIMLNAPENLTDGVYDLTIVPNNVSCFAKKFIIRGTGDIKLHSSWCSAGYNELIISQSSGNYADVYDCRGNLIFEGSKAKEGEYLLRAVCDYWSTDGSVAYTSNANYYYTGENDYWEITRIDDEYRVIKQITLSEAAEINITTDSDNDALDLAECHVAITIPVGVTYSGLEPAVKIEKASDSSATSVGFIPLSSASSPTTDKLYGNIHAYQSHGFWRAEATSFNNGTQYQLQAMNNTTRIGYSVTDYPRIKAITSSANAPAGTTITVYGIRNLPAKIVRPAFPYGNQE